jgi:hypothetical protein
MVRIRHVDDFRGSAKIASPTKKVGAERSRLDYSIAGKYDEYDSG